jgi:hypothetical protein
VPLPEVTGDQADSSIGIWPLSDRAYPNFETVRAARYQVYDLKIKIAGFAPRCALPSSRDNQADLNGKSSARQSRVGTESAMLLASDHSISISR